MTKEPDKKQNAKELPKEDKKDQSSSKTDSSELIKLRKDVTDLKTELNAINEHKEKWFKKKQDLNAQVADIIKNIKTSKSKRNSYTKLVKEDKEKRTEINVEIRKKIEEAKAAAEAPKEEPPKKEAPKEESAAKEEAPKEAAKAKESPKKPEKKEGE